MFCYSPVVNLAASVGHGPYALGYQTAFDSSKSALTKHNLAFNYNAGDMTLNVSSNDFKVSFIKDNNRTVLSDELQMSFLTMTPS